MQKLKMFKSFLGAIIFLMVISNDLFAQATNKLDSTGNVGAGTRNPIATLSVSNGGANGFEIDPVSSGTRIDLLGYNRATLIYSQVRTTAATHSFGTNQVNNAIYIANYGNVGVGTENPMGKLSVSNNGANGLEVDPVNSAARVDLLAYNRSASSYSQLRYTGITHSFGTSNVDNALYINNAGNVGIGTSVPSAKLFVEGNITANGYITSKKVTVTQLGWSDYVFDKEYNLRTLSSLETFINQYKHLPEVPSAKEVEENGINVGDTQALLLKKIEELTLYTIILNKKIVDQEKNFNHKLKEITQNIRRSHKKK